MMTQVLGKSAGRPKTCRTWKNVQALQVLMAGLLLVGCASKAPPQAQYVRVEVPVQVPCRAPEVQVPAWATTSLKKGDSPEAKILALLAERRQRIGYERMLEASNAACR